MKVNLKFLDDIDEFFETQDENTQKIILILPLLVIGFLIFYFVFPMTDEMLKNSQNKNQSIKQNIKKNNDDILKYQRAIVSLNKDSKRFEQQIKVLLKTEKKMNILLDRIKFVIFNLDKWAKIYNTIPEYIKENNLVLLKLDNKVFMNNKILEHKKNDNKNNKNNNKKNKKEKKGNDNKLVSLKMEITLKVAGDFKNVVRLINNFEARKDLVKITSFKTDGIISEITISIYGTKKIDGSQL